MQYICEREMPKARPEEVLTRLQKSMEFSTTNGVEVGHIPTLDSCFSRFDNSDEDRQDSGIYWRMVW